MINVKTLVTVTHTHTHTGYLLNKKIGNYKLEIVLENM